MRLGWSLPVIAVLAVAPALADEEGVFQELAGAPGKRVLTHTGGRKCGVPDDVYTANQALLTALRRGDKIRFTLDRSGNLASISRAAATDTSKRTVLTGRYESHAGPNNGMYWLVVGTEQLMVSEEVYNRHARVFGTVKKNDILRLSVDKNWVLEVAFAPRGAIKPEVEQVLALCLKDDLVTVNGELYKYIKHDLIELHLRSRIPGSNPPEWVKEGVRRFPLEQINTLDNPSAAERKAADAGAGAAGGPDAAGNDLFVAQRLRVGDMIGIDVDEGQIIELNETHVTLRLWRNEDWAPEPRVAARADVKAINPVALQSRSGVAVEGGDLALTVRRSRVAKDGPLSFEVELLHQVPNHLLVGAKLKLRLSDAPAMAQDAPATWTEEVPVPVLFEGQSTRIRHAAQESNALDGRVEVDVPPGALVPLTSKQAQAHILGAIEQAGRDVEALQKAYVAAGKNGDPELARLLAARALAFTAEAALPHHEALIAGLNTFGPVAPQVISRDILGSERQVDVVRLERGQLKVGTQPKEETPSAYKRRLIGLLAELQGGLQGEVGRRLFDFALSRESDYFEAVEAAFTARPADAVTALLDVATSIGASSTQEQQTRANRAAALLQKMGGAVLADLLRELRRREIPVDELEKAAAQQPERAPEIVHAALGAILADAVRKTRAALDARVDEARALADQKRWSDSEQVLREVLRKEREHPGAVELMPTVLVQLAAELAAKDRAAAADRYKEAVPLLQGGEQTRVKALLAELALSALDEEVETNVIRARPHELAGKVGDAQQGQQFVGREVVEGWVEVPLSGEAKGYLRVKCLKNEGGEKWFVLDPATPFPVVSQRAEQVRTMSETVTAPVDELLGRLCAREAKHKYEEGDAKGALPLFTRAKELAPTDPRLELYRACWMQVYKMHLATIGAIMLLVVGLGVFQAIRKPKRVKFGGDFKYYGADRSRRERDLDVEEGAPPDAGAAPPADAPPGGAPP